jgi:TolB protein
MDADGRNPKNLSNHKAFDADPAWSPDGKKIAFVSDRLGRGFRLFVMDADGSNVKNISPADNPRGFVYPAWSPDRKKIIYAGLVNNALELFIAMRTEKIPSR